MTDRASAEGLREAIEQALAEPGVRGHGRRVLALALEAYALRDHSDSGDIDENEWRQAIVEWLGPQRMSLYLSKDIDRMATGAVIADAIRRARASTPRTKTDKRRATFTVSPRAEHPYRVIGPTPRTESPDD